MIKIELNIALVCKKHLVFIVDVSAPMFFLVEIWDEYIRKTSIPKL